MSKKIETNMGDNSKQQFELQYDSLREIGRSLVDGTTKVAGFLLVAIGWIASSAGTRDILRADPVIAIIASVAVVALLALASLASWMAYKLSNRTYARLVAIDYLPIHCFEDQRVTQRSVVTYIVGNILLGALLITILFRVTFEIFKRGLM